ncbi:MAG: hypothetical protein Q8O67_19810 [Deltaproteobacteria bacterium]|nr:hypothetical protein [Deltaproteobacteria bacterium]
MKLLSPLSVVVVVVGGGACFAPVAPFAVECEKSSECGGLQCRPDEADGTRRCLPSRKLGERGESCALPFSAKTVVGDDPDLLVDEQILFGAAGDDVDVDGSVDQPDVSLVFSLPTEAGLRIEVDGPTTLEVVVGLRRPDCDGQPFERFGFARPGRPAVVAVVDSGGWELVLDGKVENAGTLDEVAVHVRVSRLPCTLGYVPVDDECVGLRAVSPLAVARRDPGVGRLAHHLIVAGGVDVTGVPQKGAELFDLRRDAWTFTDHFLPRRRTTVAPSGDDALVVGGDTDEFPLVEIIFAARVDQAVNPIDGFFAPPRSELDLTDTRATCDAGGGVTAGVTPTSYFAIKRTRDVRFCREDRDCGDNGVCATLTDSFFRQDDGVCICGDVDDPDCFRNLLQFSQIDGLDDADGIASSGGVTIIHERSGFRRLLSAGEDLDTELVSLGGIARQGAALLDLGDDRRVLALGGVDENGLPLDLIERYDAAVDDVAVIEDRLPVPMARPRAVLAFDGRILVAGDDDDVVWLMRGAEIVPLGLPSVRGEMNLVSLPDGGAAIVGGVDATGAPMADVFFLDRLRQRQEPEPLISRCEDAIEIVFDAGVAGIDGSTIGRVDRFRSEQCVAPGAGRDVVYRLQLDAPSRLSATVTDADGRAQLTLLSSCDPPSEESCTNPTGTLQVERLDAGDWYLVVNDVIAFTGADQEGARTPIEFSLAVTLDPAGPCPPDAFDPVDDDVAGAGGFAPGLVQTAVRTLCDGDVDHVLIDHVASADVFSLRTSGDVTVTVAPAVIDEAASVLARSLVFSAGDFTPFVEGSFDAPAGLYVLRAVGVGPSAGIGLQRRSSCLFDVADSLLGALDDAVDPLSRSTLADALERSLCAGDAGDVALVTLGAGETVTVGGPVEAALVRVVGGVLGEEVARGATLEADVGGTFAVVTTATQEVARYTLGLASFLADTCEEARRLSRAGVLEGSTDGFANDLDAERLGDCTEFQSTGLDVVFAIDIGAGETFSAVLTPIDFPDLSLYLLRACPANPDDPVCVAGADEGNNGVPEGVDFTNNGAAGTFFIVVDTFSSTGPIDFILEWAVDG